MGSLVTGYLDPGSGSVIVQVLLGGAAGVAVAFKLLRHRITRLFRRPPDESLAKVEEQS
jgi:hypothetical protein